MKVICNISQGDPGTRHLFSRAACPSLCCQHCYKHLPPPASLYTQHAHTRAHTNVETDKHRHTDTRAHTHAHIHTRQSNAHGGELKTKLMQGVRSQRVDLINQMLRFRHACVCVCVCVCACVCVCVRVHACMRVLAGFHLINQSLRGICSPQPLPSELHTRHAHTRAHSRRGIAHSRRGASTARTHAGARTRART